METIERNDVDISSIFNWGRCFEVIGDNPEENLLIYMKLLGDADLNKARVYALRQSADLRKKLKEQDSDERLAYLQDIDDIDLEQLVGLITAFSMREISNNARNNVKIKEPKAPKSSAKLEELEKFQKDVDEYPNKRSEAISKEVDKALKELNKELNSKSKEELYSMYTKLLVNEFCEKRALDAFREMQVYLGCYKDSSYKIKLFESFDEFQNLQSDMKKRFIDAYNSLDIDMSELKKLRLVTL